MREDDILRLSMKCADLAVHGEQYAATLADGLERTMKVDAGVGVITWHLDGDLTDLNTVDITVAGTPPLEPNDIRTQMALAPRHPVFGRPDWSQVATFRVSDFVSLPRFWDTDVWLGIHGHGDRRGRYPAGVNLGCHGNAAVFVGVHRAHQDFTDDDMEALRQLRGPLLPALAFRHAWDDAARRLQPVASAAGSEPLTPREAQVLTLVTRGWTNRRIGHWLGISERTVRKHLENVYAKLEVSGRTAAATRWQRSLT